MSTSNVTAVALCCLLLLPVLCAGLILEKEKTYKTGRVIGIDLGTTYSCVGVYKDGRVDIIANDQGNRITPSWVAFTDTERLIGDAAKNQAAQNPEHTISDVKRLIGRKFDDPEVQRDLKFLPYEVVNKDGRPYIQVNVKGQVKVFSPEEISAIILTKMRYMAESYLGKKIKDAVVTVPAYFNDAQRQATKDAGTIAGLNVVRVTNEPTAAAIAYGLDKDAYSEKNILVFDLGGGTFDVSILAMDYGVLELLATTGDAHLGGEDFDHRIMDYFIKLIKKKHGKDISKDSMALWKLRRECERAKRVLSNQQRVRVEIESLFDGVDFSEPLTRTRFEELNMDLFRKTLRPVEKALAKANLSKSEIHEIVLVGGSSRIPKVQELLKDMFNGKKPCKWMNPDEAVAYGAAVQGAILSGNDEDETKGSQSGTIAFEEGHRLTQEDIDRLVKEAKEFAEEDRIIKEKDDARNRLETYIYNMKTQINDKIESEDKERIESTLKEALDWLDDNHNAEKDKYQLKSRRWRLSAIQLSKELMRRVGQEQ